jgi:hypothetical protein
MLWLLLSFSAYAQDDLDLSAVKKLEEKLPLVQSTHVEEVQSTSVKTTRHKHPFRPVSFEKIIASETEYGHVRAGKNLIRLKDNQSVHLSEEFFGKFYRLQDELGFKYIQSRDGTCLYKIKSTDFTSVEPELVLYEPPMQYTPAPKNIIQSDYDKKLRLLPEASLSGGIVLGSYMRDLFNDSKAGIGLTTQYGMQFTTDWKVPMKVGGIVKYERSTYNLRGNGRVTYTSPSFGPVFKTKDFDMYGYPIRFQTQFRVSPFSKAFGQTVDGEVTFKFNSADLFITAEHPIKYQFGEFIVGFFFQSQWLNFRDQPEIVSIRASNQTNKAFGLTFAQVFE